MRCNPLSQTQGVQAGVHGGDPDEQTRERSMVAAGELTAQNRAALRCFTMGPTSGDAIGNSGPHGPHPFRPMKRKLHVKSCPGNPLEQSSLFSKKKKKAIHSSFTRTQ